VVALALAAVVARAVALISAVVVVVVDLARTARRGVVEEQVAHVRRDDRPRGA